MKPYKKSKINLEEYKLFIKQKNKKRKFIIEYRFLKSASFFSSDWATWKKYSTREDLQKAFQHLKKSKSKQYFEFREKK